MLYIYIYIYISSISAHEGRLRRRAEGGAGSGVRGWRLVTARSDGFEDPARQGPKPGREELAGLPRRNIPGSGSAGPSHKRHGRAPRGARPPISRGRGAPRKHRRVVSALRSPLVRG